MDVDNLCSKKQQTGAQEAALKLFFVNFDIWLFQTSSGNAGFTSQFETPAVLRRCRTTRKQSQSVKLTSDRQTAQTLAVSLFGFNMCTQDSLESTAETGVAK